MSQPTSESSSSPISRQKKICMIGSFAVGKTSLINQYVHQRFSEKYLTTVGVKIDRKIIQENGEQTQLLLWDLNGDDAFQRVRLSYLRGAHAYVLVIDGTRANTLETALQLQEQVQEKFGEIPFVVAFNKADIRDQWELEDRNIDACRERGWDCFETCAKDQAMVEKLFTHLVSKT